MIEYWASTIVGYFLLFVGVPTLLWISWYFFSTAYRDWKRYNWIIKRNREQ